MVLAWGVCNSRSQSRHHLFTECRTWTPQIKRPRRRVGKNCGWEHPRAPSAKWLWREVATGAVLEFLRDTRARCRSPFLAVVGLLERGAWEGEEWG